jgi:hypothetical protein
MKRQRFPYDRSGCPSLVVLVDTEKSVALVSYRLSGCTMKISLATAALAAGVLAAPSVNNKRQSAVKLDAKTNIWKSYKLHANNFYRAEVEAAVKAIPDSSLAVKAAKVADVGTFLWL